MTHIETMRRAEDAKEGTDKLHFLAAEITNRTCTTKNDKEAMIEALAERGDINTLANMMLDYIQWTSELLQEIIDGNKEAAKAEANEKARFEEAKAAEKARYKEAKGES